MAIWKTVDDWVYEYFDSDTPASEFDGFAPIVDLWNSKKNGRELPSWSDFDFFDFKGWHGKIAKSTHRFDPYDYQVDLFGTEFVHLFGRDLTNVLGSELVGTGEEAPVEFEFYEWITDNKYIGRMHGNLLFEGRQHMRADILDLPFSDDGVRSTHSIEVLLSTDIPFVYE